MESIYITGHKNPDTDSIVSAMAYAALRNALGDNRYTAARLGHISDETQRILNHFGKVPPMFIKDVRTQIRDLEYDTPPVVNSAVAVNLVWNELQNKSVPAIPVADDQGKLYGMLARGDVAEYDMEAMANCYVDDIPIFNLLSVLEGKILTRDSHMVNTISGEVVVALPQAQGVPLFARQDTVLICGQQPEVVEQAIEANVACVVVCQGVMPEEILKKARETCVIATPFDAYRTARLIFHAMPVARVCNTEDLNHFHLDDYIDDVREAVLQSRNRSYPILDVNDKVVGTLSRFHLIRPKRKKVVLVDHNEFAQSVAGLDQAEILEIIDHHRLADIQTNMPIFFRNEPVGSTATIVAGIYQDKGLMPSPKMAGLIASAIVSDTVMFKSPTATERDRRVAERMARMAGETLEDLGKLIFSADNAGEKSARDMLFSDYKDFRIAGHDLAIGQITCLDSQAILDRKDEFLREMKLAMEDKPYSFVILMVTDVLLSGSHLIYLGDSDTIQQAFNVETVDNTCFLPKVMSRKKQVIPSLSALWG
ncbi:MAG: putative manganese-dependent inorganic diphosphatase [Eubacteriales bacterium]